VNWGWERRQHSFSSTFRMFGERAKTLRSPAEVFLQPYRGRFDVQKLVIFCIESKLLCEWVWIS